MIFGSVVLEVAIALFLIYFLLALITSAVNEWIAGILALRAKNLRKGIENLLDDPTTEVLANRLGFARLSEAFYQHRLIQGLSNRSKHRDPSYIPARTFARVLLQITAPAKDDADDLQSPRQWSEVLADLRKNLASGNALSTIEAELLEQIELAGLSKEKLNELGKLSAQLDATRQHLIDFELSSEASSTEAGKFLLARMTELENGVLRVESEIATALNQAQANVEAYFNAAMDRVSGWYARRIQWVIIGLSLVFAIALNIDTLAIVQDLMADPNRRAIVAEIAENELAERTPSDTEIVNPQVNPADQGKEGGSREEGQMPDGDQEAEADGTSSGEDGSPEDAESIEAIFDRLDKLANSGLPIGWGQCPPLPDRLYSIFKTLSNCEGTGQEGTEKEGTEQEGAEQKQGILQWWVAKLAGLLITAAAVSLGAPFWFDLLNKAVNIRQAGPKN